MPKNKTMRITGGFLVRRRFLVPPMVDDGLVRPTPDRVREAVFSMIAQKIVGAVVLDLFAGSGSHGFEAISRGAKSVRFIEKNPNVAAVIQENIKNLGLLSQCTIEISDVIRTVLQPATEVADVIFVDPPYAVKLEKQFFASLRKHLSPKGIVIFRCFKKDSPLIDDNFVIEQDRIYGGVRVFILRALT